MWPRSGNIYVNRNQIGAIVGSQPFGGEGLSGTGPKAGGPHYLPRFYQPALSCINDQANNNHSAPNAVETDIQNALDSLELPIQTSDDQRQWLLPGPTGESNQLSLHACGRIVVIANNKEACLALTLSALSAGCAVLSVCTEKMEQTDFDIEASNKTLALIHASFNTDQITTLHNIDAVAFAGTPSDAIELRKAMAKRQGKILPLVTHSDDTLRFSVERHVCIDTTAAGGNATLLASAE